MIYRTTAAFIVLFWLTMTALLVHQEIRPADSALREIPVAHVVKLFFMHRQDEQQQTLLIRNGKTPLGHLRLTPLIDEPTQKHILKFSGDAAISMLEEKRERVAWRGEWEMDKLLNTTQRFRLAVTFHTPTDFTRVIEIRPAENVAHYEVVASNGLIDEEDFTLDENGVRKALSYFELDPGSLPINQKRVASTSPTIKARLSSMTVEGDSMDTYLVTIESNGQTMVEAQVDQLGRVLEVKTILGITLAPEGATP